MGYGLSVAPQNRWVDEHSVGHASGSSDLLCLEASWARVSQSSPKTGGGMVWMMHVASSSRLHGDVVEDGWVDAMGCIRLFCPNFAIFLVLGHNGSLAISFSYK
jgi:hypothetical protein